MSLGLKFVCSMLFLAAIGVSLFSILVATMMRPELTVEVVNARTAPLVDVAVRKADRDCGPHTVLPGQTLTCRFSGVGGEYTDVRFGNPPETFRPHGYANGHQHALLHRLTFEADGGTSFACNRMCDEMTLPDPDPEGTSKVRWLSGPKRQMP